MENPDIKISKIWQKLPIKFAFFIIGWKFIIGICKRLAKKNKLEFLLNELKKYNPNCRIIYFVMHFR